MAYKFFRIGPHNSEESENELNAFLQSHRILDVDKRWIDLGEKSFWMFCIDYQAAKSRSSKGVSSGKSRIDYREVLSADQFAVFAKLRDLRAEIAQADAIPLYAIFTNEQLAQMVKTKAATKSALEAIQGVGGGRLEKYGERFLGLLSEQWSGGDEANRESV